MSNKGGAGIIAPSTTPSAYDGLMTGIARLLESSRRVAARAVNAVMTTTDWEIGRRIVALEQGAGRKERNRASAF